jgi:hypothetical protein
MQFLPREIRHRVELSIGPDITVNLHDDVEVNVKNDSPGGTTVHVRLALSMP